MRLFKPNIQKMLAKKKVNSLIKALRDPDEDIRVDARKALEKLRHDGSLDIRLKCYLALETDEELVLSLAAEIRSLASRTRPIYEYDSNHAPGYEWPYKQVGEEPDPDTDWIQKVKESIPERLYVRVRELSGW
jgi:hypothetical protein